MLCAALATAFASDRAYASPSSRLVYSRSTDAASCPDEEALRRAVAARVGYDVFFPWATRTIVATLSRADGVFVASVELVGEDGIRHGGHELKTHADEACGELLDPLALAVTIAIDPKLLAPAATVPTPAPAPRPPTAPALPVEPPPAPPVEPPPPIPGRTPAPLGFEGSLGPTVGVGFAPLPSIGGTLGFDVRRSRFSVGLEGSLAAPLPWHGALEAWPVVATVVPCVHLGPFFGCALAEAGALHASARGLGASSSFTAWGAAGGRVGARIPLTSWLSLRGRADLLGDIDPPKLVYGSTSWSAPLVAGAVGFDAVVRFA